MRSTSLVPALLLVSLLAACHSYEPVTVPFPEYSAAQSEAPDVRVILVTGERMVLEDSYFADGAIHGYSNGSKGAAPLSVPLTWVRETQLRKPHASRKLGYIVGGALLFGTIAASAGLASAASP